MPFSFLDLRGDSIIEEQVLGCGSSAVVLLQNGVVVKTPLRYLWSSNYEIKMNINSIQREQDIYRRLQSTEDDRSNGIVRCIGFSTHTTQLAYIPNGDIPTYLSKNQPLITSN